MQEALRCAVDAWIVAMVGHHKRHDVKLAVSAFSGGECDVFSVG